MQSKIEKLAIGICFYSKKEKDEKEKKSKRRKGEGNKDNKKKQGKKLNRIGIFIAYCAIVFTVPSSLRKIDDAFLMCKNNFTHPTVVN